MKKTISSFTAQTVTYETTLPFKEVIARLDKEVGKPDAGASQFMTKMAKATTKQEVSDAVIGTVGDNDFAYFFELNHYKWLNALHESNTTPPGVVYAIGNPLLAETFVRYDIRAGYGVPPRLMIVQNADDTLTTVFYHLPSSLVNSDDEKLLRAVRAVDEKLERLIERVTAD